MAITDDFIQGSQEWLDWRRSGIGASEAPVIMGVSPYATIEQLWLRKLGRLPEQLENPGMILGRSYEPTIRRKYEEFNDIDVFPTCVRHSQYPFLIASLDGLSPDGKTILEAKYLNRADFAIVRSKQIPAHHYPQLQHQLMCLEREDAVADYVCFNPNEPEKYLQLRVRPDIEYQKELFKREQDFWRDVEQGTAPVTDRWRDLSRLYAVAKARQKKADERVASIEADIEAAFAHEAAAGATSHEAFGLRMSISETSGKIRYGDMIAELAISQETVERYRQPATKRVLIKSTRSAVIEPHTVASQPVALCESNGTLTPETPTIAELSSAWTF
jgi:putative phage-type endonuclease